MEKQLQKLQSDLKNGFITKSAEQQTIDSITNLKEKIEKEKYVLDLKHQGKRTQKRQRKIQGESEETARKAR